MISFRLFGHDKLDAKLARGQRLAQEINPDMRKAVLYVQGQIPGYPSVPPLSDYRRTGTLGRSVTAFQGSAPGALGRVEQMGGNPVGYVGTALPYAPYVIDRKRQAWMHRGRWYVLQDVVEKARDGVTRILQAGVRRILE